MTIPQPLLDILVCPRCKGTLEHRGAAASDAATLRCARCGLDYPVRDGIPIMLIDEAKPIA